MGREGGIVLSDNAIAVKLLTVLAVTIFLANLMGVGAASPFAALQAALSVGPDVPGFEDPFQLQEYVAFVGVVVANRPDPYRPLAVNGHRLFGYDLSEYYRNINSRDGEVSYIQSPEGAGYGFFFQEPPDMPTDVRISRIDIEIQARTSDANVTVLVVPVSVGGGTFIPASTTFQNYTSSQFPAVAFSGWENLTSETIVVMDSDDSTATVDISFVRFSIWVGGQPSCEAPAGAWFPVVDELACQFAQGVDWFITALQFAVNAIVFAFLYVMAWAAWTGGVIAAFSGGVLSMALWFLELDAPAPIQALFAIVTVAIIGFFSLMVLGLVRG